MVKLLEGLFRKFSDWVKKWAKTSQLYALVRRRALDKRLNELWKKFIHWITFAMLISEYNENHKALKINLNIEESNSHHCIIYIYRWYLNLNTLKTHDNSKSKEAFHILTMQKFCGNRLAISSFYFGCVWKSGLQMFNAFWFICTKTCLTNL